MSSMIDSVRGMRDVLPQELAGQLATAALLDQTLASYGYQPIELPIIEQRDLYGRKGPPRCCAPMSGAYRISRCRYGCATLGRCFATSARSARPTASSPRSA